MTRIDRRAFLKAGAAGAAIVAVSPALLPGCSQKIIAGPSSIRSGGGAGYFATNFGIDDAVIRSTLSHALERGGDYADVYFQHKITDFLAFEDGQVNRAYAKVDLGAGVRVLRGDQTGYAFTEDLTLESLTAAADTAASIAKGPRSSKLGPFFGVPLPDLYERKQLWVHIEPSKKIELVQQLGEKVLAGDPHVIKVSISITNTDDVFLVATSEGRKVEDTRPMTVMTAVCAAEKDGRKESNSYRLSTRQGINFYSDTRIDKIAREVVRRTLLLFDAATPPAGEMPVVLAPASSGILLHEAIGHGMEADFNRKEVSIYATMLGKKVAMDFVTIVDTALETNSRGAIHVDDEGIPGQRTLLVENGRLRSYLHDRISAKHYNVNPTGNGRRQSFRHVPMPRMRVTTMENGPHDPKEIINSVKRGIYALDFSNGQVKIGAGDYSFFVKTGYLIEDGKLTRPIKDTNLIGNGPDSLTKTVMVGNDKAIDDGAWTCGKSGQMVPVSIGLPTIKISSITVGGVNG